MIECVFTVDYEIYGDGRGALGRLVYEPAAGLRNLFAKHHARFVCFVEVAELEKIDEQKTDHCIGLVKRQVRELRAEGFEIGLHLHPQWYNGVHRQGQWVLDFDEYNLCTLPEPRVSQIVERALAFLRDVLAEPSFTPLSFRAGNWLFQPTQPAASVLSRNGLGIDSSVFKGGVQRGMGLDYRRALHSPSYWAFSEDVNTPDPSGAMIEVPIHSLMVAPWRMVTRKRAAFSSNVVSRASRGQKPLRLLDLLRVRYPLKLDFCRMTLAELTRMFDRVMLDDCSDPAALRPVVAIGHTKDLQDVATVEAFLRYLEKNRVPIVTFADLYERLARKGPASGATHDPQGVGRCRLN